MPTPGKKESQKDFVSRCIPIVVREGTDNAAAIGKCFGIFRSAKGGSKPPRKKRK